MLSVNNLTVCYGNIKALDKVSLEVNKDEIVAVIGSNGAGKTTLLMTISGILKPVKGSITFMGKRVDRLEASQIVHLGLVHLSQNRNIFPEMTVAENLELGAFTKPKGMIIKDKLQEMYDYFEILRKRRNQKAGFLSGGEQQILAFARCLMSNPAMILLDEPSEGLAPKMVEYIEEIIQKLRSAIGLTVLLVEQNAFLALNIADRCYVFETGRITKHGKTKELKESKEIKRSYLGM